MIQGTPEWYAARAGKVTGSCIKDMLAKGKGGKESTTRRNYMTKLAIEILTGEPVIDPFSNGHMERGKELEDAARQIYEFEKGVTVEPVGFVDHPHIPRYGVSPDGLVGPDGMIQIKCPIPAIHVEYLRGSIPGEYVKQIQAEMDCTGRQWSDFVSYCPVLPVNLQLAVIRLERDEAMIEEIRMGVLTMTEDVDALVADLMRLRA